METKIFFKKNKDDNVHYRKLKRRIKYVLTGLPEDRKKIKIYMAFILPIFYVAIYFMALNSGLNYTMFFGLYALLGVIAVLIFMNIIHDAVHNNIFNISNIPSP